MDSKKTTKISLIFYITIATMPCMQNGISLQYLMVRMHVTVLVGQLNEWLLMQACSDLSLDKYHQSLSLSLPILKYLAPNRFGFLLQKSLKTNIIWRKGLKKAVHYQDQDLTTSLGHLQTQGRSYCCLFQVKKLYQSTFQIL